MVRPWMVALLVLVTDHRRSSGVSLPQPSAVSAEALIATTNFDDDEVNATEIASVKCNYKGRSYEPGSLVGTDQPCLKCTCVTGNLVCHLQVCPELPDPPPQGCVIVHKKNKCCAQLQCYYEEFGAVHSKLFSLQTESRSGPARMENSAIVTYDGLPKGCVVNGTIYAEGSAMDSSSLCEYCYCIKGHQQCVRPQCSLTIPGCTAVYKKHACCPIKYKCSPLQNTTMKNTTEAPTTEMPSSLYSRLKDCRINGRLISLGEPVIGVARSSCETCFCINGQVRCDKVICPPIRAQISPNCGPVYSEGHCCPTSYNCSTTGNNESSSTTTTTTTTTMSTTTATATSMTSPSTVTVRDDDIPLSSSPSSSPTSSIPSTMSTMLVETESTQNSIFADPKNTTEQTNEDPLESRNANPAGLMLDEFGGLNVTEKSNNFEMDYDEPTLPPSLPNLKIIPFVAADAVVDEPAPVYDNYQPVVERVYNVSDVEEPPSPVVNSFSPPIETEGGFIPKDSPEGALYVPDKFRTTTTERALVQPTPLTPLQDKSGVEHQSTGSSVWCMSNGKKYKHGELLTDPSACDICVCFNAKIVCQENCPAVKVGCQRISDPNNSTCCGRIVCSEFENDITTKDVQLPKLTEVTSEAITTTTKNRDAVIEHIIYSAPPTEKPIVTSPQATTKISVSTESTSSKPITSTSKSVTISAPTTEKPTIASTSTSSPAKRVMTTTALPKQPEDEDYSFESMFSFLFNGDPSEQPASSPPPISPANSVGSETRIEHRTDDEIDEKVQFTDVKPQTNNVTTLAELFKTYLDADVEKYENSKNRTDTESQPDKKHQSKDEHGKIEQQNMNKPTETKPITETKQHANVKPHFETKQKVDPKPNPEIKHHVDGKPNAGVKQHVDAKPHPETKPQNPVKPHTSVKQQTEVKTHFDVKDTTKVTSEHDFKHQGEVKPYQDPGKHQAEVKTYIDVRKHPEVKPYSDSKIQTEVKTHSNVKHPADFKPHLNAEVKPHPDYKRPTDTVKPYSDHEQRIDISSRPEIKQYTEPRPNPGTKPLKTKIEPEFKLAASMLKISGCNIYGRMYRVGKIIAELSNPCLECMCTEIGVHCNQLKC